MELKHSFTVPASVDRTWDTFMDIEGVATCFPGAKVTDATTDEFHGTVKVKLGPIALTYAGSGAFVEKDEGARRAVIEAKGKDKRGNGTAGATVTIVLEPDGDETTKAEVSTDLTITGKPAQFGRGVIQDVSDKILGQFLDCVEGRLGGAAAPEEVAQAQPAPEGAGPEAAAAPPPSGPEQPSGGEAATGPGGAAQAPPAPAPVPARAAPAARPAAREEQEALDIGGAVLPILLRTYGPYLAAGAVGLVIGYLLGRR